MKVILSRKGFDSANGGIASPIFEDGTMLSFPIPSKDEEKDKIKYDELTCNGISLECLLRDLGYKGDSECCHLDPDLTEDRRKTPIKEWKPAFGQINQAATYLLNQGISKYDLFLFFGNFRHIEQHDGKFRYIHKNSQNTDSYYGREIQAIWGYLQVGEILKTPKEQEEYFWHPHSCAKRMFGGKNNLIFTPTKHLSFAPQMPGCGLFNYDKKRVLSAENRSKATWKYQKAYDIGNISAERHNSAKDESGIYYAGIWQELVLKENTISENWAKSLFI